MPHVERVRRQAAQLRTASAQLRAEHGAGFVEAPRPWPPWRRIHGAVADAVELQRPYLRAIAGRGYLAGVTTVWENGWYVVMIRPIETAWGPVLHLLIANLPNTPVRSWTDLLRIKDEVVGAERTAVEVFPPRSEVVDAAPMTHLWVLPDGMSLPFTLITDAPSSV